MRAPENMSETQKLGQNLILVVGGRGKVSLMSPRLIITQWVEDTLISSGCAEDILDRSESDPMPEEIAYLERRLKRPLDDNEKAFLLTEWRLALQRAVQR